MTCITQYLGNCLTTFSVDKYCESFTWGFATGTIVSGGNIAVGIFHGGLCAIACGIHQMVMPFFQGIARPNTFLGKHPYLLQAIPITLSCMLINGLSGKMIFNSSKAVFLYVASSYFQGDTLNKIAENSVYRQAFFL